jgi:hypothetical protein
MTLQEIKDQVAKESNLKDFQGDKIEHWSTLVSIYGAHDSWIDEVTKRYAASECAAKDARIKDLEEKRDKANKKYNDLFWECCELKMKLHSFYDSDLTHKPILTPKDKQP